MSTYLHDVMDFGAIGDGVANDTAAFRKAIEHAEANGGKVVASGRFKLSGYVGITCDCDWSQATLVIDKAMLLIGYSADYIAAHEKSFTPLDKSKLVTLQSSLQGVLDAATLKDFENAYVRVTATGTNAVYINKATSSAPQNKFSVSLMNKYGRLSYSLSHDFTEVQTVAITLRRLPPERLTFVCPRFEILDFPSENYLLKVSRDLVTIRDFTLNHGTPAATSDAYYSLIGGHDCYDLVFENTSLPGYGITNSEPGVTQKARNDILLGKVLKVTFDTLSSNTGWKTVDCSNSRDIRIYNAHLYGLHCTFNCADISLSHCRIRTGGVLLSTGAPDSCMTIEHCTFTSRFGGAVALYPDFGDLRGKLVIANCQLLMSSLTEENRNVNLLSLTETAIVSANQPNTYALPTAIVIRDIYIQCKAKCDLITFNNGTLYTAQRRLTAPRSIVVDNVKMQSRDGGNLNIDFQFIGFEGANGSPSSISVNNVENLSGNVVMAVTRSDQYSALLLLFNLEIAHVARLYALIAGNQRSTARLQHCTVRQLDTVHRSRMRSLAVSDCTFDFDEETSRYELLGVSAQIQSSQFSNCVFDASGYKASQGHYLALDTTVHQVSGCMSIDCHGSGADDAAKGLKVLVPKQGTEHCYATTTDGTLVPLR